MLSKSLNKNHLLEMLLKIVCSLSHFESRLRQLFWSNTKPEIVFFSERGKSWRRKNISVCAKILNLKKRKIDEEKISIMFFGEVSKSTSSRLWILQNCSSYEIFILLPVHWIVWNLWTYKLKTFMQICLYLCLFWILDFLFLFINKITLTFNVEKCHRRPLHTILHQATHEKIYQIQK